MFQRPRDHLGDARLQHGEPEPFDADVTLGAAGFSYNMGLRVLEEQGWIRMFGQWYDFTTALADSADGDMSLWEETYDQAGAGTAFRPVGHSD